MLHSHPDNACHSVWACVNRCALLVCQWACHASLAAVVVISHSPQLQEALLHTHTLTNIRTNQHQQEVEEEKLTVGSLWSAAIQSHGWPNQHTQHRHVGTNILLQMECKEIDSFHNQPFVSSPYMAVSFSVPLLLTCGLDLFIFLCEKQTCVVFGGKIAE